MDEPCSPATLSAVLCWTIRVQASLFSVVLQHSPKLCIECTTARYSEVQTTLSRARKASANAVE